MMKRENKFHLQRETQSSRAIQETVWVVCKAKENQRLKREQPFKARTLPLAVYLKKMKSL